MRYRDQNGQDWADIIDFLTMWPDARRRYAGELIGPQRSMSASSLGNQFLGAKALVLGKANVGLTTD